MRILICDDDTLIIEQLQKYIESYFESNHLKCPELVSFTSGESLLADKNEKDIVFLDIEMPGMNGIYVGNELKKANKKNKFCKQRTWCRSDVRRWENFCFIKNNRKQQRPWLICRNFHHSGRTSAYRLRRCSP